MGVEEEYEGKVVFMTGCGLHRDESVPEAGGVGRKSDELRRFIECIRMEYTRSMRIVIPCGAGFVQILNDELSEIKR